MPKKKRAGAKPWLDPDDAPELTAEHVARADVYVGETRVRRGRGRPRAPAAKKQVTIRLDPELLERLHVTDPGWQTRIAEPVHEWLEKRGRAFSRRQATSPELEPPANPERFTVCAGRPVDRCEPNSRMLTGQPAVTAGRHAATRVCRRHCNSECPRSGSRDCHRHPKRLTSRVSNPALPYCGSRPAWRKIA